MSDWDERRTCLGWNYGAFATWDKIPGDDQNNTRSTLSGFCTIHIRIFLLESVCSTHRNEILRSAGFPCSGGKAAGHGLPTTVVDTEVPKAYLQAMAWSEAVEFTQAAQEATTAGLGQFQQLLGSQACTRGVAGFA